MAISRGRANRTCSTNLGHGKAVAQAGMVALAAGSCGHRIDDQRTAGRRLGGRAIRPGDSQRDRRRNCHCGNSWSRWPCRPRIRRATRQPAVEGVRMLLVCRCLSRYCHRGADERCSVDLPTMRDMGVRTRSAHATAGRRERPDRLAAVQNSQVRTAERTRTAGAVTPRRVRPPRRRR